MDEGSKIMVAAAEGEDEASPACPSASEAFVKGMTNLVNTTDVERMVAHQQHMLTRFEKTNEMLLNFNHLSENRFATTQLEFRKHIQLLLSTKKDLENVFRRIRVVKDKLRVRYPEAFSVCAQVHHVPDDVEDEVEGTSYETLPQPTAAITQLPDAATYDGTASVSLPQSTAAITQLPDAATNDGTASVSLPQPTAAITQLPDAATNDGTASVSVEICSDEAHNHSGLSLDEHYNDVLN